MPDGHLRSVNKGYAELDIVQNSQRICINASVRMQNQCND